MGKGKRVKTARQMRPAAERPSRGHWSHDTARSPWDAYLDARAVQGHDVNVLAVLALTPFRVTETAPGVSRREPRYVQLATLAKLQRTTVASLAESLRSEAATDRLRWDADARLATLVVKPELNLVLIDDVLRVFPHRYVSEARCVARTSAGRRCRNPLAYGQPGPWSVWQLPGEEAAYVQGFDLDDPDLFVSKDGTAEALKARFLNQRCIRHRDSREVVTDPEWETFDLEAHRPQLSLLDPRRLADATISALPWPAEAARELERQQRRASTMECPF